MLDRDNNDNRNNVQLFSFDLFSDQYHVVVQLFLSIFLNADLIVTWIVTFYQLMLVVVGVAFLLRYTVTEFQFNSHLIECFAMEH